MANLKVSAHDGDTNDSVNITTSAVCLDSCQPEPNSFLGSSSSLSSPPCANILIDCYSDSMTLQNTPQNEENLAHQCSSVNENLNMNMNSESDINIDISDTFLRSSPSPSPCCSRTSTCTPMTSSSHPVQHPIFALPLHQHQNPSQIIIPPVNEQSPGFMIPLPTIYVPIIPLNPWQMTRLKSRVSHQLRLKRKRTSSSSSTITNSEATAASSSHPFKMSRNSMGGGQNEGSEDQDNNENDDDQFIVVVDADMNDNENEDFDSKSEAKGQESQRQVPVEAPEPENVNINGGDDNTGKENSPSSSRFTLRSRESDRTLWHQVKEVSQRLLTKLTESEERIIKSQDQDVQVENNCKKSEGQSSLKKAEDDQDTDKNNQKLKSTEVEVNQVTEVETSKSNSQPSVSVRRQIGLEMNPTGQTSSSFSATVLGRPPTRIPSSNVNIEAIPASIPKSNSNLNTNANAKTETGGEVDAEPEPETDASNDDDPEFEEEYEPVDLEETENQNQADEDDEENEGGNSSEEARGGASSSSFNVQRNQSDIFKGCLALSSEVVLSYGKLSSCHEKLNAVLYGENYQVIVGGFLVNLSYTFKGGDSTCNCTYNNNDNNFNNSSSNNKECHKDKEKAINNNNNMAIANNNFNNNLASNTFSNNNNAVSNGYCIGFYLDDLDANSFEMQVQDGRIKVQGRRDAIDLHLDIQIASPVHIEDVLVNHFKSTNIVWLKIYF